VKLQTYGVKVIKGSSGLLGAIVLATTACFAALTPAAAAPMVYVLSPPVTDSADTITVTGSFTFDASGPTLDAVDLVATGGPQPGTYTVPVSATTSQIVAEIPSTTETIQIGFAASLGDGAVAASFVTFPPPRPLTLYPLPVPPYRRRSRNPAVSPF
jgi:hypothetical protein